MALMKKIMELNAEQREKFFAVKDAAGFDLLLVESGIELTEDEKADVREYFETGRLPLSDEELENAAGGRGKGTDAAQAPDAWKIHVPTACKVCGMDGVYCQDRWGNIYPYELVFYDAICFKCNAQWETILKRFDGQWEFIDYS